MEICIDVHRTTAIYCCTKRLANYYCSSESSTTEGWRTEISLIYRVQDQPEAGQNYGVAMAVRRILYAFPPLLQSVPGPLVAAARAAVESGRAARRWISRAEDA